MDSRRWLLARSARDLALALNGRRTHGDDAKASVVHPSPVRSGSRFRIGLCDAIELASRGLDIGALYENVLASLSRVGAKMERVGPGEGLVPDRLHPATASLPNYKEAVVSNLRLARYKPYRPWTDVIDPAMQGEIALSNRAATVGCERRFPSCATTLSSVSARRIRTRFRFACSTFA